MPASVDIKEFRKHKYIGLVFDNVFKLEIIPKP